MMRWIDGSNSKLVKNEHMSGMSRVDRILQLPNIGIYNYSNTTLFPIAAQINLRKLPNVFCCKLLPAFSTQHSNDEIIVSHVIAATTGMTMKIKASLQKFLSGCTINRSAIPITT